MGGHMASRLPDINGLPAYRTINGLGGAGTVVFEFARGGWAELAFSDLAFSEKAESIKVAEHITFGNSTAAPLFPVQLTGLPGWQLRYVAFRPLPDGALSAGMIGYASGAAIDAPGAGSPAGYPSISVTKAGLGGNCYFTQGQSTDSVIAGYPVTVTRVPAELPPLEELCAPDADGLTVDIFVSGSQPAIDVTQVFAHLRLLGPDIGHWTTEPVG